MQIKYRLFTKFSLPFDGFIKNVAPILSCWAYWIRSLARYFLACEFFNLTIELSEMKHDENIY